VVLLDLKLPDISGMDLLARIRAEREDVEVIIVTSHAELPVAVRCMKAGAFDFLAKSYENYQSIGEHVERALEHRRRRRGAILARSEGELRDAIDLLERTRSTEMAERVALLRQIAPTPLTVLVEGESGVGKELLARFLHARSDRAAGPFVPVNMAAIPPSLLESTLFGHEKGAFTSADRQRLGKFELAEGGTLFFDEVGELEQAAQAKLLRALQERQVERLGGREPSPVDVRVIAATNKDLEAEVVAGRFREDLWYRLNVVRVKVPPLRQRREDVPALVELLGRRAARTMHRAPPRFSEGALGALAAYPWPGNVRELENLVMRLVALHPGREIGLSDLPVEVCLDHLSALALARVTQGEGPELYALAREHFERYLAQHMVDRCGGNKAEAARRLGISYSTLKAKLSED
jgi:DNA-binding NtrC family response regulator